MNQYLEILKKYSHSQESFDTVLRHSLEVLAKSIEIMNRKKLYEADLDLLVSGSILHDIGTFGFLEGSVNDEYIRHGIIGAEILRSEGLDREARIAERHTGAGITKEDIISNGWNMPHEDFLPETLEEKIVCYADKFSSKNPEKRDTPETIEAEFREYGEEPLERFLKLREMFG